jgi:hypothetical protein
VAAAGCPRHRVAAHDGEGVVAHERDGGDPQRLDHVHRRCCSRQLHRWSLPAANGAGEGAHLRRWVAVEVQWHSARMGKAWRSWSGGDHGALLSWQWWQWPRSREGGPSEAKGEVEGELRRLFSDTRARPHGGAHDKRRMCELGMAATRSDTRHPYRHFTEHLVSDGEVEVEHQFGLSIDRIRSWAQKQS